MVRPADSRIHFLLVDDDEDHVEFTRVDFDMAPNSSTLSWVPDGEEALRRLRLQAPYETTQPVDVVILDVSMPGMNGHEVLREIRRDPSLTHVPVVMFTSSDAEEDRRLSYELHANGYVVKPLEFQSFLDSIKKLDEYWSRLSRPPEWVIPA